MTDLSLRYLLYGEDKTASKAIKGVGAQAHSTAGMVAGGLSKIGNAVGGEAGDMIDRLASGLDKVSERSGRMGAKMAATGTVAMGLGVALQSMASGDVQAQKQLEASVEATGKSYAGFGDDVERLVQKQVAFGNNAQDTKTALRVLTQAYGDPKKALAQMSVTTDLAAAKHISLAQAAGLVAKVHGGAGKVLKEFGLRLTDTKTLERHVTDAANAHDKALGRLSKSQKALSDLEARDRGKKKLTIADQQALANAHDKVAQAQAGVKATTRTLAQAEAAQRKGITAGDVALSKLAEKLKGQGSASMDTFGGKIKLGTTWLTNQAAVIGEKYGPALTVAGGVVTAFGTVMQILQARQAAAAVATTQDTVATSANTGSKIANKAQTVALAAMYAGSWIKQQALSVAGWVRETAVMLAHKTASIALNVATKVMAAGQWLLNAALAANPIGLVVAAIALLVAGLVIAYKKSATFHAIVDAAFKAVGAVGKWLWNNALKPAFGAIGVGLGAMGGAVKWLWNNVFKPYFGFIGAALKVFGAVVGAVWSNVLRPTFLAIGNAFLSTIGGMLHAAANIASFLHLPWANALQSAATKVDGFKNNLNKSIAGVTKDKKVIVGVSFKAGFVTGAKGLHGGGVSLLNPTSLALGGVIRGGKKGIDSVLGLLMPDEFVVRADGSNLHEAIAHFAGGARRMARGGLVSLKANVPSAQSVAGSVKSGFGQLVAHTSFQSLLSKLTASTGGGGGPAFKGGSGVSQWASTVLQVLAMLGQSPTNLGAVLRLIQKESGGNANAVNNWDSNAKAGHPSGGLIQTIASTFNKYAGALRGLGMFNPLANIFAGLNYAIHTYGSIAAIDPRRHAGGYAGGTTSAARGGAWVGERGREWLTFRGGEKLTANHQLGADGGGVTVNVTVNGAMDPNAVARQIQTVLLRLKRTNGVALGLA